MTARVITSSSHVIPWKLENPLFERVISTSRKGSLPSFFSSDVRVLAVKTVQRYVVQWFQKKKTVVDITSIHKRFEKRRTVVKPWLRMERHKYKVTVFHRDRQKFSKVNCERLKPSKYVQLAKVWYEIISNVLSTGMLLNNEAISKMAITTHCLSLCHCSRVLEQKRKDLWRRESR